MYRFISMPKAVALAGNALHRVKSDIQRKPSMLLIALVAGAAAAFLFGISVALIWSFFILFLMYDWDTNIMLVLGGMFIVLCVYFTFAGNMKFVEATAVYAYFFLGSATFIWLARRARELA